MHTTRLINPHRQFGKQNFDLLIEDADGTIVARFPKSYPATMTDGDIEADCATTLARWAAEQANPPAESLPEMPIETPSEKVARLVAELHVALADAAELSAETVHAAKAVLNDLAARPATPVKEF